MMKEPKGKHKLSGKKGRSRANGETELVKQFSLEGEDKHIKDEKKKNRVPRNKKRKSEKLAEVGISETDKVYAKVEDGYDEKNSAGMIDKEKRKSKKKKRSKVSETDNVYAKTEDGYDEKNSARVKDKERRKSKKKKRSKEKIKDAGVSTLVQLPNEAGDDSNQRSGNLSRNGDTLVENRREAEEDEVHQVSSGDEDCSKGMKKWITKYHLARPGVKILQQKIDDFIVAHEAQEEKARKEREAQAAEGGWTVVVHHKGRKKTTDSESGTTVGSVAQASVMDKMNKKKNKELGLDFYRFQKREAQRSEIMMLQSKFEQDKKRIQQMRAARKFRPY